MSWTIRIAETEQNRTISNFELSWILRYLNHWRWFSFFSPSQVPTTERLKLFGTKKSSFPPSVTVVVLEIFCGCVEAGGNRSNVVLYWKCWRNCPPVGGTGRECGWPTKASTRWNCWRTIYHKIKGRVK